MKSLVLDTLRDSNRLSGTVVIIDVFRSSNTIIELLHCGAARIVPVKDVAAAKNLKTLYPEWILLGERGGTTLEGFDGGNSPTEFSPEQAAGRTFILTTSGGTRCIESCVDHEFIIGSFANASAVARWLKAKGCEARFWAVGRNAAASAEEDLLCARYLEGLFADTPLSFEALMKELLDCPGAERLRCLGQREDLAYCTQLDIRSIVPVGRRLGDGTACIT